MPVFRTVSDARSGNIRLEAVHQPLYDQGTLNAVGDTSYFTSNANKTKAQTNLVQGGALPWPKRFSIRALRQVPQSGTATFSNYALYVANSFISLVVGEKNYLTVPSILITAGTGLENAFVTGAAAPLAPANGNNFVNHGRPEQRNIYSLLHAIYIPPIQNFSATITVGTAIGTATVVWLVLEGELLREIQ